jgi:hypothetical protein
MQLTDGSVSARRNRSGRLVPQFSRLMRARLVVGHTTECPQNMPLSLAPCGPGYAMGLTRREVMADRGQPQDNESPQTAPELLSSLSTDAAELVRSEITLARAELAETGRKAAPGLVLLGGAAVCGLLALHAGAVTVLRVAERVLPRSLAAPAVAVGWASAAGWLALTGRERLAEVDLVPRRTVESVKEDVQWASNPRTPS